MHPNRSARIRAATALRSPARSHRSLTGTGERTAAFTRRARRAVVPALLLLAVSIAPTQAAEDVGLWATGTARLELDELWYTSLTLQPRFNDDIATLERLVIRPSISRRLAGPHTATLGYDAHVIESPRDRVEHRTWQQWGWKLPVTFANLSTRVRLEQRFIEDVDGTALRARFKGTWTKPLGSGAWRFVLSDEVLVGLNDVSGGPRDGYDQNRAFAGFGTALTPRLNGLFGYQMQHIGRPGDDLTVHQLMISLTVR